MRNIMNKILIIDDTKENLEAVKDSLEILIPDCLVITTESGKEGLKAAKDVQPDVIISDVFMPQMDGIEVCKRLKADEATKHIPVIIHTGSKTDAETRTECLEAGADVFLAKPIDAGELTAQINAMLRIKKAEDKLLSENERLEKAVQDRTKELKKSEKKYKIISELASDYFYSLGISPTGKVVVTWVSEAFEEVTTYPPEEIKDFTQYLSNLHPDDLEQMQEKTKILFGNSSVINEYRIFNKNNEIIWLQDRLLPIWDEKQKKITSIFGAGRDITNRKKAEQDLKESEKRYKDLAFCSVDWIWEVDKNGRYTYASENVEKILGHSPKEILTKTPFDFMPKEEAKRIGEIFGKIAAEKKPFVDLENLNHAKDGREVYLLTNGVPILDDKGNLKGYRGVDKDITERKKAEKIQQTLYNISYALNATDNINELYSKIRELLGDVINTTNFYIALYNEKTDMISLPFDVDEKDDFKTFPAGKTITKYVIKTGKSLFATKDVVKKLIKKGLIETVGSPSEIWLGVPLKIDNKVIGVIAVQSYDDPNLYTEKDIEILNFISEEIALAINRKQAEEDVFMAAKEWQTTFDTTNDAIWVLSQDQRVLRSNKTAEKIFQRSNEEIIGKHCWEIIHGTQQPIPECPLIRAKESLKRETMELQIDKNWFEITVDPVLDTNGKYAGAIHIVSDITERKQAEEELKNNRERLKTANSILRHDIANDLIVIKSALDIYHEEQDKTMLDEIDKRVEKSLNTIKQQREQERFLDSHSDLDEYQIDLVIDEVIKDYPDVICNVTGAGKAYADNAIYSVFENIISNAKIHGKSAKLDIDISYNEDFCEIRFADDGIGIADEIKHKVFEKGFQFGENGHTGIGLYIVKKTIDDYGGEVFIQNNTPKGAVFVIRLKKTIER
jgi:PAS domain S-box-containing protein